MLRLVYNLFEHSSLRNSADYYISLDNNICAEGTYTLAKSLEQNIALIQLNLEGIFKINIALNKYLN